MKRPYMAGTGQWASTTKPETWSSFAVALGCVGDYDGLGFVFTAADPFVGIDLDGCRDPETGAIQRWAQTIIDDFETYSEVSPSGTGVKLFCRGALPAGAWNKWTGTAAPGSRKTPAIECYDQARYFTMTGQPVPNTPAALADCTEQIAALQARRAPRPPVPRRVQRPVAPARTTTLEDALLLQKAKQSRTTGAQFRRLWAGDWQKDYESHSEADLRLCSMLAFWAGKDAPQMDRLFRASGLMRDKWEDLRGSDTYGSTTIQNAIAGCGKMYTSKPFPRARKGRKGG